MVLSLIAADAELQKSTIQNAWETGNKSSLEGSHPPPGVNSSFIILVIK